MLYNIIFLYMFKNNITMMNFLTSVIVGKELYSYSLSEIKTRS